MAPGSCPVRGPSYSGSQGAEGRTREGRCPPPRLPSWLPEGRQQGFTQPVADTALTWGQQRGWREGPDCALRGRHGAQSHRRPASREWGPVPSGKLILMANTEPSWRGRNRRGRTAPPSCPQTREAAPEEEWVRGDGAGGRAGRPISLAGARGRSPVAARASSPPPSRGPSTCV